MQKFVLVYQAGLANVFRVQSFTLAAGEERGAERVMQHAFGPCEWYARGLQAAGARVRVAACNMAGDVNLQDWTDDLVGQPFSDSFRCGGLVRFSDGKALSSLMSERNQ